MAAPDVWVAKDDGSDIIRATAIAGLGRDYDGKITGRLTGGEQSQVTLVAGDEHETTPLDFHLQLLRILAGLSDTAEPAIIRPGHEESRGWSWRIEPL